MRRHIPAIGLVYTSKLASLNNLEGLYIAGQIPATTSGLNESSLDDDTLRQYTNDLQTQLETTPPNIVITLTGCYFYNASIFATTFITLHHMK
jgi:hypothetical protein